MRVSLYSVSPRFGGCKSICISLSIASRGRLRLASAGLAVTTATTAATAGGLSSLVSGLLAVVVAAGVAVTESYRYVSPKFPFAPSLD